MLLSLLFEDTEAEVQYFLKMLLGKKSRWPGKDKPGAEDKAIEIINHARTWDPTGGKYIQFIVRDVAANKFVFPEDGPPLKETLEIFNRASKKRSWEGKKDIMQYDNWRELQRDTSAYAEKEIGETLPTSEKEWVKRAKEGSEKIVDMTIQTASGLREFSVIKLNTPAAVTVYGRGTRWCTSCSLFKMVKQSELDKAVEEFKRLSKVDVSDNPWKGLSDAELMQVISDLNEGDLNKEQIKVPNPYYTNALQTAQHYLNRGSMYIVYKDKQPYAQLTGDGREMRNISDVSLRVASPALAMVFREMVNSGKLSSEAVKALTSHVKASGLEKLKT